VKNKLRFVLLLVAAVLLLTGCGMTTVDEMYKLPKRSEDYNNLQSAIDSAMTGLAYCAPLAGENRQTVHMADLDGDEEMEFLLFAKGTQEKPLRILLFKRIDDSYVNTDTVECTGSAFDQVEYVDMDGGGMEMIVGCQLSNQVIRSAAVYALKNGELVQKTNISYTKFLTADLDNDSYSELFVLRPGATETDNGVAELYCMRNQTIERYNEVPMSQPADRLKRIVLGKLDGGKTALYIASAVGDNALITDVYTVLDKKLVNVTLSNESGTSIQTMRNYYVFADDIDSDGVVELPSLIPIHTMGSSTMGDTQQIIRWYAMNPSGEEVDKLYTYHDFAGGWYLQLYSHLAPRTVAVGSGDIIEFYIWNETYTACEKVMTLYVLSGHNREEQGLSDSRFILQKTDTLVYAASLEPAAKAYEITEENIVYSFRLIQQDWKTGET